MLLLKGLSLFSREPCPASHTLAGQKCKRGQLPRERERAQPDGWALRVAARFSVLKRDCPYWCEEEVPAGTPAASRKRSCNRKAPANARALRLCRSSCLGTIACDGGWPRPQPRWRLRQRRQRLPQQRQGWSRWSWPGPTCRRHRRQRADRCPRRRPVPVRPP